MLELCDGTLNNQRGWSRFLYGHKEGVHENMGHGMVYFVWYSHSVLMVIYIYIYG